MTVMEPAESAAPRAGEESVAEGAAAAGDALSPEAPGPDEVVTRAAYDQLKAERDQLLDRIARLQAEFDNARKRAEREKAEFRDYAVGNVVEQFLPVLDKMITGGLVTLEKVKVLHYRGEAKST